MDNENYISTKKARKILGVTTQTLRNWDSTGKINTIRSASGVRLYCFQDIKNILSSSANHEEKKKIAYCRVSSKKQENDLKRQTDFFRYEYPDHVVVTDIASGLNFKRKGLKTILELALQGNISEVMVAHKDRLCRYGFELLEWIFNRQNIKLVILDNEEYKSPEEELANDILSIIHIFSCKQMGGRRYKIKKNKDLPEQTTKENSITMDKHNTVCIQ